MNAAIANIAPSLAPDPIIERLEDQIGWYDRKSISNMHWFKRIKITEIVSAAIIPFLAATNVPRAAIATGGLGVLITVFEGMLQLNQFHENWIRYRSTCESLKHENIFSWLTQRLTRVWRNPARCWRSGSSRWFRRSMRSGLLFNNRIQKATRPSPPLAPVKFQRA